MSLSARFRFPWETVLRIRSLREEQARLELNRLVLRLERTRQALMETESLWAQHWVTLQKTATQPMAAQDYQIHTAYLNRLKANLRGWQTRLAEEKAEIARQKLRLQHYYQERRLLSQLRNKKFAQFKRELAKFLEKEAEAGVLQRRGAGKGLLEE
jgi:flagellar export protein FliJ|uniref:Flagellar FliJ protein n=1 Tax=Desulfobacca acetoxidans TaxID=60893 RepID=A0A7C3SK71_9BACT